MTEFEKENDLGAVLGDQIALLRSVQSALIGLEAGTGSSNFHRGLALVVRDLEAAQSGLERLMQLRKPHRR